MVCSLTLTLDLYVMIQCEGRRGISLPRSHEGVSRMPMHSHMRCQHRCAWRAARTETIRPRGSRHAKVSANANLSTQALAHSSARTHLFVDALVDLFFLARSMRRFPITTYQPVYFVAKDLKDVQVRACNMVGMFPVR